MMNSRINWHMRYRLQEDPKFANAWRWTLIGFKHTTGDLYAHYVFATKPTRRQVAQTKRGQRDAVMIIE